MVDIIPPRRDEFLTDSGVPTLRFSEYLELLARSGNDQNDSQNEFDDIAVWVGAIDAEINLVKETLLELDDTANLAAMFNQDIDETNQNLNEFDDKQDHSKQDFRRHASAQAADYTTSNSEIVICTNPITITLNPTPEDQEFVSIQSTNGTVTIEGNGNTINDEDNAIIRRDFTTWDLIYIVDIDGWIII